MSTAAKPRANETKRDNVSGLLSRALDAGQGLLRLTPTWVPRSFLHPGKRIKLHPDDWYAYGAHRGGIDERWFASTTEAANEGRVWHEGLSFCEFEGEEFLLRDAVAEAGAQLIGKAMFKQVQPLARLFEVLRQHGPDPAPHAPGLRRRQAGRPGRQARELLLPAAATTTSTTIRLHVHGPRARHDEGPASASAWKIGARATTASSICRGRIA